MKRIIERIGDTLCYNIGIIPEEELYIVDHIERGNVVIVRRLLNAKPDLKMWSDPWGNSLLHINPVGESSGDRRQIRPAKGAVGRMSERSRRRGVLTYAGRRGT